MFVAIVSRKRGKRILKTLSVLVCLSCFMQFSGLVNLAAAAKIDRNTLNLKKQLPEPPTLKPPKRSPLGEKIMRCTVMLMPAAVKEYVYKIESIEQQLDLLEQKLESGEDINIDYRIVLAKLAGLKSLRKEVQRNFRIRSRRLKERLAKKEMPVVRNALDALQKQRREFREAAAPVFETLEAFGIADAVDRVKINRLRRLVKRLKVFKRRLPRSHDNPLPWRSVERNQVKPETESSVTPAYMRSSKNRYAARITRKPAGSKSLSAAATGAPMPDDLSETPDVVITRQMRDIVERLGHSPARIYEWVKNNIQSEFYHGSLRGSAGTLAKRAGNDTDTCSLLIALLRAAGVPCRYVQGTVEIPMQRAKALTGIEHEPHVGRYFANAGIPVWNTGTGRIRFEHTWVEAWVDYMPYGGAKAGTGDTWVPLSPWYKDYENTPGTDLAGLTGFDREMFINDYMQTVRTDDPADAYKMYFDNWFRENGPGRNWQEGLGSRSLKPEHFRKLPATVNFEVISFLGEHAALPQDQRHTVTIEVPEAGIAYTMNIMDCIGKKISFAYLPADNETRDLINERGGIDHIHPLSVNLLPTLLVDGKRTAAGKTVNAGFEHAMRVTFYVPGFGSDAVIYEMVSGVYYVLGIDPQHVTNKLLSDRLSGRCAQAEEPVSAYENMDETPGDALYVSVMKYFRDRNTADYDIAALSKVRVLKETTCALIGRDPQVIVDRFGLPVSLDRGLLFIDSQRDFVTPVSVAGDSTAEKDFLYIRGYNASYNEHDMFEDYVGIEAVSTVKLLQIARQHNMPVYTIDAANSDSIIPLLGHDEAVKQVIRNAVHRGRIVTVHKDPVTVKQWRGVGYIERDPVTHAAGYYGIGRKGFASAVLTDIQSEVIWQTGKVGTTCGNPVSMASGNKLQKETDLVLPAAGKDVDITRYYNSRGDWVGLFGHGWTFTCDEQLHERSADGQVVYRTADGRLYTYTPDADGTYTAEPGNYAVLTKTDEGFVIRKKGGTRHLFNPAGKLMQIVDRNGNSLSFSYSGDALTGITDAAGRRIDVECRDGKITRITTPDDDNTWTYTYNGDDLVKAVNNAGQTVSYTYRDHNMTSRTGPGGKTVVYEYYSSGKVHCELLPNGAEMVFSYNSPLRIATMRGGCCSVSHHYYNRYGLNTGHMDALGYEELVEYDDQLNVVKVIDKKGGVVKNTYDENGNLLTKTDQLNHTTAYTHEPVYNQVLTVTDGEGNTTTNTYDDRGNLLATVDPEGVRIEHAYYENGLIKTTGRNGIIKAGFTYYADGTLATVTDGDNNTARFTYNALGRLTGKTDANGNTTAYELDKAGNIITTTDAEGNRTVFTYNEQNLRTSMTDGRGNTTTYEYNAYGKLITVTDPMGFEKSYTYTPMYELASETDKNGNTTFYVYDELRRVVEKQYADGSVETFTYDPEGRLISAANSQGTTVQEYDAAGRLVKTIDTFGQEISYTYYADGSRKSMTDPQGGVTQYDYYANGQIKSITGPSGKTTAYAYTDGLLEKISNPNGTETVYGYDTADRVHSLITRKQNGEVISDIRYEYDGVGNRLSMTDTEGVHTYEYDMLDQVVRVDYPDGTFTEYTYDPAYNRATMTTPDAAVLYVYDDNNRLIEAGDVTFSYDANGNQISRLEDGEVTAYRFDAKNQLAGISFSSGTENTFAYNAFGQRITRKDGSAIMHYLYDGRQVLMQTNGQGVISSAFVNGSGLIGPLYKKNARDEYTWYVRDALGTATHLTDEAGDIAASYRYDIFGAVRSSTVIDDRGIRNQYTGKELDDESGLMYFGARYYNPEIGRFVSADTYTWGPDDERGMNSRGQDHILTYVGATQTSQLNLYVYTANNPVKQIDPDGHLAGLAAIVALIMLSLVASSLMVIARTFTGTIGNNAAEVLSGMVADFMTAYGLLGALPGIATATLTSLLVNFVTTLWTELYLNRTIRAVNKFYSAIDSLLAYYESPRVQCPIFH